MILNRFGYYHIRYNIINIIIVVVLMKTKKKWKKIMMDHKVCTLLIRSVETWQAPQTQMRDSEVVVAVLVMVVVVVATLGHKNTDANWMHFNNASALADLPDKPAKKTERKEREMY